MSCCALTKPTTELPAQWLLPSGALLQAQGLCTLARPRLTRGHQARDFRFFEATLLVVTSGTLLLENSQGRWALDNNASLMAVAKNTQVNVHKALAPDGTPYSALFLNFAPALITEFHQRYSHLLTRPTTVDSCTLAPLDEHLNDALQFCLRGIESPDLSAPQQTHRALGLLLALQERGIVYPRPSPAGLAERLTHLLAKAPEQPWTAALAGHELAVSEATLRRRLAEEGVNFSTLLTEIRMHHAMMLLQTTHLGVSQIADACGYRALSRFSMRFKRRFGFSLQGIR